ncbi:MAG: cell division protein FtsA [Candidatus Omnitrophica bacterium]|nr:cell division protein FtsA [Candidatus Omnitrophota bacterium]
MMKYICSLDIGSSKIAACIGFFKGKSLVKLWLDSIAAAGVKQGLIQDAQALTDCIARLLKKLKAKSGIKVKSVHVGIASHNITVKYSQAVIALAERGNKSVTKTDIARVNQQAQILGSCLEEEILHITPLSYVIDNENEVINPLGLYGHQLKVNLCLISTKVSYLNTITEIANRAGIKLNSLTLSGLAASQAAFSPGKIKGLNVLCDIGKDITQVLIFNDDRLTHCHILEFAGDDLTTALSGELNIPYSLAEEVKISYGSIQNHSKPQNKEIIVKKGNDYLTLDQDLISDIISKRSLRLAEAIRDIIRPYVLTVSLPSYPHKPTLYATGRTVCLDGFLEALEVVTGIPVKMAKIGNAALLASKMHNRFVTGEPLLNHLASFGLVWEAINSPNNRVKSGRHFRHSFSHFADRIKEIYQEYF